MNYGKMNSIQKELLINFMEMNPKVARNTRGPSSMKEETQRIWEDLTNRLNSVGGPLKTAKQWKRTWTDLKINCKKKATQMKLSMIKTGSGEPPYSSENEEERIQDSEVLKEIQDVSEVPGGTHERILAILEQKSVEGIKGTMEAGIQNVLTESDESVFDDPLPKRTKRSEDHHQPKIAEKEHIDVNWLEIEKRKVDVTEKVAEALTSIANQLGRIADSFESYNNEVVE